MPKKNAERAPRQVTVQPQEKPPEAGQPHLPHTHLEQPGQAPRGDQPDDDEVVSSDDAP
jgi:hypothetical protein